MSSIQLDSAQSSVFTKEPHHRRMTRLGAIFTTVRISSFQPVSSFRTDYAEDIVGISRIAMSDAARLSNKTVPIPDDPGQYVVSLDVFHQLHCLVGFSACGAPSPSFGRSSLQPKSPFSSCCLTNFALTEHGPKTSLVHRSVHPGRGVDGYRTYRSLH
jgi:hypothetical protein